MQVRQACTQDLLVQDLPARFTKYVEISINILDVLARNRGGDNLDESLVLLDGDWASVQKFSKNKAWADGGRGLGLPVNPYDDGDGAANSGALHSLMQRIWSLRRDMASTKCNEAQFGAASLIADSTLDSAKQAWIDALQIYASSIEQSLQHADLMNMAYSQRAGLMSELDLCLVKIEMVRNLRSAHALQASDSLGVIVKKRNNDAVAHSQKLFHTVTWSIAAWSRVLPKVVGNVVDVEPCVLR